MRNLKHLTKEERELITVLHAKYYSTRKIAKEIGLFYYERFARNCCLIEKGKHPLSSNDTQSFDEAEFLGHASYFYKCRVSSLDAPFLKHFILVRQNDAPLLIGFAKITIKKGTETYAP